MSQALRDIEGNYHINGKLYRSITAILHDECPKMQLDAWKERTPDWREIGRKARIYGTFMHLQLQSQYAKIPVDVPTEISIDEWPEDMAEELEERMKNWKELGLKMGEPNLMEHTIVIERAKAAGTWDWFGPVDDVPTILDWKSSKRPQKSHKLQLGAYYIGAIESGIRPEWGMIAYIRRNGAELVEMTEEELREAGEKFIELAARNIKRREE